jgi:hypothetical protein
MERASANSDQPPSLRSANFCAFDASAVSLERKPNLLPQMEHFDATSGVFQLLPLA